ncbi:MAG: hypothetical protein ACXVLT_14995 [Flavisolibacter sp.]
MKLPVRVFGLVMVIIYSSCKNNGRYLDLSTNEHIVVKKDTTSGYIMNKKTGEPVDFYVDTKTHDTVYGATGETVNGRVKRSEEGRWLLQPNGSEFRARSESENSAKLKVEGGHYKAKKESYTLKKDKDGDVKIENGKTKLKIDGKTGKRKVKKDSNITDKVKNIFH